MSPVHVIVGHDPRAEAMWASAFTGAVDLYRFDRNVDAFERLTAAQAPIDLVVLTPAQDGPFNLTADQFIARVLEGPLGTSRFLSSLHIIVVGQPLARQHARVMGVSTLDAAIRLVKFGEIEQAPRPNSRQRPRAAAPPSTPRGGGHPVDDILAEMPFAGSVISNIWDAPRHEAAEPELRQVVGGGGASIVTEPVVPQLFSRAASTGFVVASNAQSAQAHAPVVGGGELAAPVGAPHEAIEVSSGVLQPARPYTLAPGGGSYRGVSAVRAGHVHGAAHPAAHMSQPVPPELASQVHAAVYGAAQGGQIADPILTWSNNGNGPVIAHGVPVPTAAAAAPAPVRTVPIDPPAGAYGHAPAAPQQPARSDDPFLRRAEQGGGDVSFG